MEGFDEIIHELKKSRNNDAHPTTLIDDSPATPEALKVLAKTLYNNNSSKDKRALIYNLIDRLDRVSRVLNRDIL